MKTNHNAPSTNADINTIIGANFSKNFIQEFNLSKEKELKYKAGTGKLALWEFDVEEKKTWYSPEVIELFGYSREEFNSFCNNSFVLHVIHPDDTDDLKRFLMRINANELEEFQFKARMKHKLGYYMNVCYIGGVSDFDENGKPSRFTGVIKQLEDKDLVCPKSPDVNIELIKANELLDRKEREKQMVLNLFEILNSTLCIETTLQKVAQSLADAKLLNCATHIRIVYNESEFISENFRVTDKGQFMNFETYTRKTASVEHFHENYTDFANTGSVNNDVSDFLKILTGLLRNWLNKKETELEFQNMFVQLEAKVETKTTELRELNKKLTEKNKDISDSINYANNIQRAILPKNEFLGAFNEAFVFYKPKDTVSGDFYWFHKRNNKSFIACADCTGHGVPGALMAMVGNQLLDNIIGEQKVEDPETILREMDIAINKLFKKSNLSFQLRDGMSISLCVIDDDKKLIAFAGALNNAYLFSNNRMLVLEADRHYIGDDSMNGFRSYTRTEVAFQEADCLYMFTDGLPDQFGGPKGKKLMRKRVLDILSVIKPQPMNKQKETFEQLFDNWKGNHFQVDDVTVLGIKF